MQQSKLDQEPVRKIDWLEETVDYADFLNIDEEDRYNGQSQGKARAWVEGMLIFMLELNGLGEIFETERNLAKLLGIDLEAEAAA